MVADILFGGVVERPTAQVPESGQQPDLFIRFLWYVATVWCTQNDGPTTEESLKAFDIASLIPAYHQFLRDGGQLDFDRGGTTLEESWLSNQLLFHEATMCVMMAGRPLAKHDRITRKVVLSEQDFIEVAQQAFEVGSRGFSAFTFYRGAGHAIQLAGFKEGLFTYFDPWPGASLLLTWNLDEIDRWRTLSSSGRLDPALSRARMATFWQREPTIGIAPAPGQERMWNMVAEVFARYAFAMFVPLPIWRRIHGDVDNVSTQSEEERVVVDHADVEKLAATCRAYALLPPDGYAALERLYERGVLGSLDRTGITVLANLQALADALISGNYYPSAIDEPRLMFARAISNLDDPSRMTQADSSVTNWF